MRHSPRNGFNSLLRALPGDRPFLPPSSANDASTNLIPGSGRQDHTTSPSASATPVSHCLRVHRIQPRVRDVAQRPSVGWMQIIYFGLSELLSEIFLHGGLDSPNHVDPVHEIRFYVQVSPPV